jgi:hypothetical protein
MTVTRDVAAYLIDEVSADTLPAPEVQVVGVPFDETKLRQQIASFTQMPSVTGCRVRAAFRRSACTRD